MALDALLQVLPKLINFITQHLHHYHQGLISLSYASRFGRMKRPINCIVCRCPNNQHTKEQHRRAADHQKIVKNCVHTVGVWQDAY
jgi:biotin synthase-like enzyme